MVEAEKGWGKRVSSGISPESTMEVGVRSEERRVGKECRIGC